MRRRLQVAAVVTLSCTCIFVCTAPHLVLRAQEEERKPARRPDEDLRKQWKTVDSKIDQDVAQRSRSFTPAQKKNLRYAAHLTRQAGYLRAMRYDAKAEAHYREVLKIFEQLLGKDHLKTIRLYDDIAACLLDQFKPLEAETWLLKALPKNQEKLSHYHPTVASNYYHLGTCYQLLGRIVDAKEYHEKALKIRLAVFEAGNLQIAASRDCLGSDLTRLGHIREGEKLLQQAFKIRHTRSYIPFAVSPHEYAASLNNLGDNLYLQGRFQEAAKNHEKAYYFSLWRDALGPKHPETVRSMNGMGMDLVALSQFAKAARWHKLVLERGGERLGKDHPDVVAYAYNLAVANYALGKDERAKDALQIAAKGFERARMRSAFQGYRRSMIVADRSPYPFLACLLAKRKEPRQAWQMLEQNLGRGLLDDLSSRDVLSKSDRDRERELVRQLQGIEGRLQIEKSEAKVKELRLQREKLQFALRQFERKLITQYGLADGKIYDLPRIQKQLADDAAFLAWLDVPARPEFANPGGEHWACLVRNEGEPVWVKLPGSGANGAWTTADEDVPGELRERLTTPPGNFAANWRSFAKRLYHQRLVPIGEHLRASADRPAVRHLIVLPSAALAGIPIEALFAAKDDRTCTVSYSPCATFFSWLVERQKNHVHTREKGRRILVLGDPAFRKGIRRLPGTRLETEAIKDMFAPKVIEELLESEATFKKLQALAAADRLREFGFLHVATHGHADVNRPMSSHLVLAAAKNSGDRLTAAHILSNWKLDADLVTISACESGLGRYSGGEGYVGFAQALFVAGARTLVLSMWQVDDPSTALLMRRFYCNLLGKRAGLTGPLAKAEALAEAQNWLRNLTSIELDQALQEFPRSIQPLAQDLGAKHRIKARRPYAHPYYWAAFRLVGDAGKAAVPNPPEGTKEPRQVDRIWIWGLVAAGLLVAFGFLFLRGTRRRLR